MKKWTMTKRPHLIEIPVGSRLSFVLRDGREIDLGVVVSSEVAERTLRKRARWERASHWQRQRGLTRQRRARTSGKIRRLYRASVWPNGRWESSRKPIIMLEQSTWDDDQIALLRETRSAILGAMQIPASAVDQNVARDLFALTPDRDGDRFREEFSLAEAARKKRAEWFVDQFPHGDPGTWKQDDWRHDHG